MNVTQEHSQEMHEQLSAPVEESHAADAVPGIYPLQTLPVKVEGSDSGTFKTIVLSTANPYKMALPEDNTRTRAIIIAIDNPVVLCHSENQAQDQGNEVASVPQPNGGYIPTGIPVPVHSKSVVFVACTTTATESRIYVQIERDEC